MRTLYLELHMGAAGDMLMSALLELLPEQKTFLEKMAQLVPETHIHVEHVGKCGIMGTHVAVHIGGHEEESHDYHHHDHDGHHHHHNEHNGHHHGDHGHDHGDGHEHEHSHAQMQDIAVRIGQMPVSERVKRDAMGIYNLIAKAESHAHGVPVEQIHFHEVGELDAVTDIVGVCLLMEMVNPSRVLASPVHVGSGQVRCAHGILPVPAPATAYILKDVPIYGGDVRGELCTPTGAAILKYFVNQFGAMPPMRVSAVGYGMGKKNFEAANCVRAYLGDMVTNEDEVVELKCNLDDMTPEALAFAQRVLLERGALDAYTLAIGMKKGRSGAMLCCMCKAMDAERMVTLIFRHTTTLGIRKQTMSRYTLTRTTNTLDTHYGEVRVKEAQGYGVRRSKYEYDDLARIAQERGISLSEVIAGIE